MTPDFHAAERARTAGAAELSLALADARDRSLRNFAAWSEARPGLTVPQRAELNPPLWELGHVGWFQEWWTGRNPAVAQGAAADPDCARTASLLPGADALFDSGRVAHDTRWHLSLPDAQATRDYLARVLGKAQAQLSVATADDPGLYFFRLALFHEDMHNEAATYMAGNLGFAVPDIPLPASAAPGQLEVPAGTHRLGWPGPGFAFDNELEAHVVELAACEIDRAPVSNTRYAQFVAAGGYDDARFWSEPGWAWREGRNCPRFWRAQGGGWQQRWFGQWRDLDPLAAVINLSCFEAEAWCAWAGRRLPTEAEWEHAATTQDDFLWGSVWEWTADIFRPYPGFVAHPYRDYSVPWFGSRRVLRGASVATHPRMRHPRYRNFFMPERNDIFAGLRSCAA